MSDQVKTDSPEEKELEVLEDAVEDTDLDDVSGGGCNFCSDGCSEF